MAQTMYFQYKNSFDVMHRPYRPRKLHVKCDCMFNMKNHLDHIQGPKYIFIGDTHDCMFMISEAMKINFCQ